MIHKPRKIFVNKNKWTEEYVYPYEKTILLFVTDICNLRCEYCFNKGNLNSNKTSTLGIMNLDYIRKIILANVDVDKYDIMGGEPLLHPQFDEIVKLLMKYSKKIGLYTNGFLIKKYLNDQYQNFKISISFQSITCPVKSYKPISDISDGIKKFQNIYPIKLVLLLNNENKLQIFDMVDYVEKEFIEIDKITIGAVRNEEDYWNDNYSYVVPFEEYAEIIQNFINNYEGRLNIDIFTKGYLYTDKLPRNLPNQLGRFKCIFPRNKYAPSLYGIAKGEMLDFDPSIPIDFEDIGYSRINGREWTDKIHLINK